MVQRLGVVEGHMETGMVVRGLGLCSVTVIRDREKKKKKM